MTLTANLSFLGATQTIQSMDQLKTLRWWGVSSSKGGWTNPGSSSDSSVGTAQAPLMTCIWSMT